MIMHSTAKTTHSEVSGGQGEGGRDRREGSLSCWRVYLLVFLTLNGTKRRSLAFKSVALFV